MVTKKRVGAGLLVMTLAAAWASGCSSSDDKPVNAAGNAGLAEAGAAGVVEAGAPAGGSSPGEAGASTDGGTSDGGEPTMSEAGSGGDAGSGSEPDPREPFVVWETKRATALCTRDVKCGRTYSVAGCVAAALNLAPYAAFYGGADYYGQQADNYALASSAVQQTCLTDIAAGACEDGLATSCSKVLVATAPLAKGALCRTGNSYLPALPCGAGLECSRGTQCSTCVDEVPAADLNGPCQYDDDCKSGLSCAAAGNNTYTCQKPSALGASCITNTNCVSGAFCNGVSCKAYALDGKSCSNDAVCLQGLACGEDKLCHPVPTPGANTACARHPGAVADSCSNWCLFATPTAPAGKCGYPVPTDAPTACSRLAGSSTLGCPFNSYQDAVPASNADGVSDNCTCQPRRPLGAACTAGTQCTSFRCVPGGSAGGSVCSARLPAGSTCTGAPGECAGSCNDETFKCQGPVVCAP